MIRVKIKFKDYSRYIGEWELNSGRRFKITRMDARTTHWEFLYGVGEVGKGPFTNPTDEMIKALHTTSYRKIEKITD